MAKRAVISALWFLAIWGVGGAVHLVLDVPRALMLLPAVVAAAGVWIGLARYEARAAQPPRTATSPGYPVRPSITAAPLEG